jgi:hypothetical protein
VLATISGAGPMTFLGTVGMIQAFHKMATAGGQIEVGVRRNLYRYDNYRCWTCCGYYCLCWITIKQIKSYIKWKPMLLTFRFNDPHNYEFKRKK